MIRLGVIGCGRIGRVHVDSIAAHPRAELACVCDPIASAAAEVAAQFDTVAVDVETLLADESVDGVVVSSPTPTHVDLLTRAVHAGKAVLCEKPIDLDIGRVDECWAAIKEADSVVMVGFN